jgi:cell shape-determining protein MreC
MTVSRIITSLGDKMKNNSIVESTLSNLEKDLEEIFDCQQKIKSLTSELQAINAEIALIEALFKAENPNWEPPHVN